MKIEVARMFADDLSNPIIVNIVKIKIGEKEDQQRVRAFLPYNFKIKSIQSHLRN